MRTYTIQLGARLTSKQQTSFSIKKKSVQYFVHTHHFRNQTKAFCLPSTLPLDPPIVFFFNCHYLSLQSFAIPGSIFLSILSGFLYPFPLALSLVCFCSATGASVCYLISFLLGRGLVYKFFPEQAAKYAALVSESFH